MKDNEHNPDNINLPLDEAGENNLEKFKIQPLSLAMKLRITSGNHKERRLTKMLELHLKVQKDEQEKRDIQ